MGYESAKMLVEIITNKRMKPTHNILSVKLIERDTV